jgi:hypothetical protein
MSADGKVMFYSVVARNREFISVLAHPLGGVSGKTSTLSIAELICQSPLLSIFCKTRRSHAWGTCKAMRQWTIGGVCVQQPG